MGVEHINKTVELKYLFTYCTFILMFLPLLGVGQDFLTEKDLRMDWTFYSADQNETLPFLDHNNESPYAIHLSTSLDFGKETYLRLEIPEGSGLFIENQFINHYSAKTLRLFSIDSLRDQLEKEQLHLTLYRSKGFSSPPQSRIGFLHSTFDTAMNVNPISLRNIDQRDDYLKIIVLLVFAFFVILYTIFPSELMDFYSITNLVTFRYTDTYLTKYRSITNIQILIIAYQAAMLSSIMIVSLHYYNNPLENSFIMTINPLFGWLIIFIITFVLVFLKYVLISIVSHLFGLSDRINFYFIEYLRMAMIFYTIIFIVINYVVINHFYSLNQLLNTLIFIVIIFNFLRFIIIYFKFQRNISIKNLHLFSYLCSTELIPLVIGLNFFVK